MKNKLIPFTNNQYKALNIVIVEKSKFCRNFLAGMIYSSRPYHNLMAVDTIDEVFSLMYGEIEIDAIFFDVESGLDTDNISIIHAISPEVAFINWSNCQHPEIIELLHNKGTNYFCLKDSNSPTIVTAVDAIARNRNILYIDERLNQCLPLLAN